jgi:Ring finger domain
MSHNPLQMEGDGYNLTTHDAENAPTSDFSNDDNGTSVYRMVIILLICVTFLIIFVLCTPSIGEAYRDRIAAIIASANDPNDQEENVSPEEIQRLEAARHNIIEDWIVSKQVQAHDDLCSKCMLNTTTTATAKPSSSDGIPAEQRTITDHTVNMTDEEWGLPEEDEDDKGGHDECPICFEDFHVGDVLSWSPESSTCKHIFHHACIKEWLLKNSGCPICRSTFLPIDRLMVQHAGITRTPVAGGLQRTAQLLQAQEFLLH